MRTVDLRFPQDFLWGASTSAYQIEGGGSATDWWAWEQAGRVPECSGRACDSWHRWREDLDLAASLGLSVYRISIEWARVEPEPGHFDTDAIARYAEMISGIRERGMQSMVVLWHFTNPAWLEQRASTWQDERAPRAFERYVRRIVPDLAAHVDWWATLNEANTYANNGWILGDWPPGHVRDRIGALRTYSQLARGHRLARAAIKELAGASAPVGLTHVIPWAHPASRAGALSGPYRAYFDWIARGHFLGKVRGELDWLGVQYYYDVPCTMLGQADADGDPPRTDFGWRIAPEGLYHALMECWKRYRVPLLVTENGLADATDSQRARFILDHVAWMHRAIADGADVRGYLHWSLMDNFEWAYGFAPRFGLAEVDFATFARTPRPSASLYAHIARTNGIAAETGEGIVYADGTGSLAPK
jgi:beta-glucosidase